VDDLNTSIREFTPSEGDWRPLDILFERAFATPDSRIYFPAIFNLFERYPEEDGAGVFWSAVHGMEAIGGYENQLLHFFRRFPSSMTRIMIRRLSNSGPTHIGAIPIATLISK